MIYVKYDLIEKLLNFARESSVLYCYGAGEYGEIVLDVLSEYNIQIESFIISELDIHYKKFDIPVRSINEFDDFSSGRCIIAIKNEQTQKEIKELLALRGMDDLFIVNDILKNEIAKFICEKNKELFNIGRGKRCFLLATGGSLKKQNLEHLKNEYVLTCSMLSITSIYKMINPFCYVSPTLKSEFTDQFIREWYEFIDETIVSPIVVLDYKEHIYIKNMSYFKNKNIYYLNTAVDGVYTGTAAMLRVAIWMGFSEIYLLGVDHDSVKKMFDSSYSYSNAHIYNILDFKKYGYDCLYDEWKRVNDKKISNRIILQSEANAFNEYHELALRAKRKRISIYNSTPDSLVDEFEYVKYENLFNEKKL